MQEIYPLAMMISIFTFSLSVSMTPGPNNIMLLTSGITFGYKKTVQHIMGIVFGFPLMMILIGVGFGMVFERYPQILQILKIVGFLYLCWMAYKIATNRPNYDTDTMKVSKPFSFIQAALFQWVNPKAWMFAITSISIFVTSNEDAISQVIVLSLLVTITAVISTNCWVLGGVVIKRFIKNHKIVHYFNICMAVILVVSILPFVLEQ